MPVSLNADQRAKLLDYAAGIVSCSADAPAVAAAAFTLMDWAERAADEQDLRERMRALESQWINILSRTGDAVQFVERARVRYAFVTAAAAGQVPR